jgi:hypothetical protein
MRTTFEVATYRRIRAAVGSAQDQDAVTVFVSSTELGVRDAAAYARDHILLAHLPRVRVILSAGKLEIGPERRAKVQRRSGFDRRENDLSSELWIERRTTPERRSGSDRRASQQQLADVA